MSIPHVCPKCAGAGETWPTDFSAGGHCQPCHGSGIVWEYSTALSQPPARIERDKLELHGKAQDMLDALGGSVP